LWKNPKCSGLEPADSADAERLNETMDRLLGLYDPKLFTLYLHCLNLEVHGGWPDRRGGARKGRDYSTLFSMFTITLLLCVADNLLVA
jgi:hypothetical protein